MLMLATHITLWKIGSLIDYSSFYKRSVFPEEVIPEKAESSVKDGVLEVDVPKKTPMPEPKKHKVAVK
jgi:HSP20 family molecular chaperone IbpA